MNFLYLLQLFLNSPLNVSTTACFQKLKRQFILCGSLKAPGDNKYLLQKHHTPLKKTPSVWALTQRQRRFNLTISEQVQLHPEELSHISKFGVNLETPNSRASNHPKEQIGQQGMYYSNPIWKLNTTTFIIHRSNPMLRLSMPLQCIINKRNSWQPG